VPAACGTPIKKNCTSAKFDLLRGPAFEILASERSARLLAPCRQVRVRRIRSSLANATRSNILGYPIDTPNRLIVGALVYEIAMLSPGRM